MKDMSKKMPLGGASKGREKMQKNENDKPRYWIAISKVDSVDMNELFACHGIWYANQDQAQAKIRMALPGHYIALRKDSVVHAIGKVRNVEKVHGVAQSKGANDLRVFYIQCLQGENAGEPGWTRINKKIRSYGQRVFVEVTAEDEIKKIWGIEVKQTAAMD
jgi:hypothetical protein